MHDDDNIKDDTIYYSTEEEVNEEQLGWNKSKKELTAEYFDIDCMLRASMFHNTKINYLEKALLSMVDSAKCVEDNVDTLIDSLGKGAD